MTREDDRLYEEMQAIVAAMSPEKRAALMARQTYLFKALSHALAGSAIGASCSALAEAFARVVWEADYTDHVDDALRRFGIAVKAFLDLQVEVQRREIQ